MLEQKNTKISKRLCFLDSRKFPQHNVTLIVVCSWFYFFYLNILRLLPTTTRLSEWLDFSSNFRIHCGYVKKGTLVHCTTPKSVLFNRWILAYQETPNTDS